MNVLRIIAHVMYIYQIYQYEVYSGLDTTTHPRGITCMRRQFQHWLCDGYINSPNGEDEDCSGKFPPAVL